MISTKRINALSNKLETISLIIQKLCILIEKGEDPDKILSLTRRVHEKLHSIQRALIDNENELCIEEVIKMADARSKIDRLKSHIELLSQYGH